MSIKEIVSKLYEAKEPSKGIFWFVKSEGDNEFDILYLDIPNDPNFIGNSKNGLTYTHEKTWKDLISGLPGDIKNKNWNYFPRGRVELKNNKATIYLNPNINKPEYQDKIIDAFHLHRISYRFIPDGSDHYKSYLD